jgi:hypothetical protein
VGWGLSSWCIGSPFYGWGYGSYFNPYATALVVQQQPVLVGGVVNQPLLVASNADGAALLDYTEPLAVDAPPPQDDVAAQASAQFDQARAAFKLGRYEEALEGVDRAIGLLPQDATLHEFRALALFALGRYEEAAAVIHAVLAVGPGWNWPTLIGLYPDIETYTNQLRALEVAGKQQADQPALRFLLAYHYITQGHAQDAATQLGKVVAMQPKDELSAQLLETLRNSAPAGGQPATVAPADAPPEGRPAPFAAQPAPAELPSALPEPAATPAPVAEPGPQFPLEGTWKATNPGGDPITLVVRPDQSFTWDFQEQNQPRQIAGTSSVGAGGLLTLAGASEGVLVGRITWTDADHFTFRLLNGPKGDAGLSFARSGD